MCRIEAILVTQKTLLVQDTIHSEQFPIFFGT